jgi:hypothetical protein
MLLLFTYKGLGGKLLFKQISIFLINMCPLLLILNTLLRLNKWKEIINQ